MNNEQEQERTKEEGAEQAIHAQEKKEKKIYSRERKRVTNKLIKSIIFLNLRLLCLAYIYTFDMSIRARSVDRSKICYTNLMLSLVCQIFVRLMMEFIPLDLNASKLETLLEVKSFTECILSLKPETTPNIWTA